MINLTQHNATTEQIAFGMVEPEDKAQVQALLTFEDIPSAMDLRLRAKKLAEIAAAESKDCAALIGGAPYLMAPLEEALLAANVQPYYAFSRRESVEEIQADGTILKRAIFRHVGFVHP